MTYYHDTGHIPKMSNHSVIMLWQLMSISLEALFAIIININHIYFCIFIHVIKLMKGKRKCPPWRLSESWYDWPSVLAIVLILVVCPTKLHKNNPHVMRFKNINLMEIIFHVKSIFDTSLLHNLPHIKIAVRYHNLNFRVNLYNMSIITCN